MKKLFIISCIVIIFLLGCNGKFKPPNDVTRFNDNIVYYTLNGRIFSTPFEEALRFAYKIKASKITVPVFSTRAGCISKSDAKVSCSTSSRLPKKRTCLSMRSRLASLI